MDNYINDLIEIGLGNMIDVSVDKCIGKDEVYQSNMEKAGIIIDKFRPNLSAEDLELFEEYMDYIMNANERACTVAYLVGAKDTLRFMKD